MQTHSSITERIVEQANKLKLKQIDIVRATGASRATVNKWFSHLNKYIKTSYPQVVRLL